MNPNIKPRKNGITIECHITPRAKKDAMRGERNGSLLIALKAPPIEGRANEALIKFMSKLLSVSRSRVEIIKGGHGRHKTLYIQDIDPDSALEIIEARNPKPKNTL